MTSKLEADYLHSEGRHTYEEACAMFNDTAIVQFKGEMYTIGGDYIVGIKSEYAEVIPQKAIMKNNGKWITLQIGFEATCDTGVITIIQKSHSLASEFLDAEREAVRVKHEEETKKYCAKAYAGCYFLDEYRKALKNSNFSKAEDEYQKFLVSQK